MAAGVSAVGKIRAIDVAVRNHDGRGSVCYFEEGNASVCPLYQVLNQARNSRARRKHPLNNDRRSVATRE